MVLLPPDAQTAHTVRPSLPMNVFPPDRADIACTECVMDCHDAACTQECTDQCVIIACDDPNHDAVPCVDGCGDADLACAVHDPAYSAASIERLMATQSERHEYHGDPKPFQTPTSHSTHSQTWDEAFDAWLCSCGDTFPLVDSGASSGTDSTSYASPALSSSSHSAPFGSLSTSSSSPAFHYSPQYQSSPMELSSPHQPHHSHMPPPQQAQQAQQQHQNFTPHPGPGPLACMWNNCGHTFANLSELVGHVNLQHLRAAPSVPPAPDLSCQWNNCSDYPTAHAIPGTSTSTSLDAALGVLANHLLQDHLGLQHSFDQPRPAPPSSPAPATTTAGPPSPSPSASTTPVHMCRWRACGMAFETVDELTAHISAEHVGAGKARYECFWEGCGRNDDKGFSSKQKICRHIQSHTGHRPFQCKICKQHFSEAATLQQHMRRHTQEKPYLCDVPGCGKAFAIAGALTIHKRTHNGDRPFKCSFCDRAFSESSNLSKHLRTHTGIRPYLCDEPDCGKRFSRPDQLARHMSVHRKKAAEAGLGLGTGAAAGAGVVGPGYRVPVAAGNVIVQQG